MDGAQYEIQTDTDSTCCAFGVFLPSIIEVPAPNDRRVQDCILNAPSRHRYIVRVQWSSCHLFTYVT